jgi:hypothetical protein
MSQTHVNAVRARMEDGQTLHQCAHALYGSRTDGHAPGFILLHEAGLAYLDTLALEHGIREPLAGTLEERAHDLAGRGACPELDDAMLEGLRWLDKGVHAICHPSAEETSDMTWPCSAKAFCQGLRS